MQVQNDGGEGGTGGSPGAGGPFGSGGHASIGQDGADGDPGYDGDQEWFPGEKAGANGQHGTPGPPTTYVPS